MRQAQAIVVNELRERGEACELVVTAGLSPNYHYDTPSVLRIGELIADAIGRLGIAVDARAGVDHQYSVARAAEVVWRRMATQSVRWSALLGSDAAGTLMERRVFSLGFEEGQGVAVWADGVPRTSAPTGVFASPPDWIDGLHGKAIRIRTDVYTPNKLSLPLPAHDFGDDDLSVSLLVQSPFLESGTILEKDKGWFVSTLLTHSGKLIVGLRLKDTVRLTLRAP